MKKVRRRFLSAALVALTALPVMATSAIDAVAVNPPHGSIVSDDPANNTPNVMNGRVNALLVMGNRVFVGGTFTTVQNAGSGQNITRNRLFSFNANTGQIDAGFNPNMNNAVEALAPSPNGQNIYVGGRFTSVNGNNGMQRIAQLQISNGAIVAGWDPNPQHHVYDLVTRGNHALRRRSIHEYRWRPEGRTRRTQHRDWRRAQLAQHPLHGRSDRR